MCVLGYENRRRGTLTHFRGSESLYREVILRLSSLLSLSMSPERKSGSESARTAARVQVTGTPNPCVVQGHCIWMQGKKSRGTFSGGALRKGRRMVIDWDITHIRAREVRQRRERLSPVEGRFVLFSRSRWEREVVLFEEGRRKSFSSGFLIGEGVHTPSCVLGGKLNNGVWEVSGDWPWNWKFTDNVQVEKIMRPDTDPCYETIEALIFRWN